MGLGFEFWREPSGSLMPRASTPTGKDQLLRRILTGLNQHIFNEQQASRLNFSLFYTVKCNNSHGVVCNGLSLKQSKLITLLT